MTKLAGLAVLLVACAGVFWLVLAGDDAREDSHPGVPRLDHHEPVSTAPAGLVEGVASAERSVADASEPAGARRDTTSSDARSTSLRFHGRVLRKEDDRPLAATARLLLAARGETAGHEFHHGLLAAPQRSGSHYEQADPGGRFELPYDGSDVAPIVVEGDGYARALVGLDQPQTADAPFVIRLERAAGVDARLTGSAVGGHLIVRISARGHDLAQPRGTLPGVPPVEWLAPVNADGRALFTQLPPGVDLRADVIRDDRIIWGVPRKFQLQPGVTRRFEWHIGDGASLSGFVRDQHGKPVSNRELWLLSAENASDGGRFFESQDQQDLVTRTRTDAAGFYRMTVPGDGPFWIGPSHEPRDSGQIAAHGLQVSIPSHVHEHSHDIKVWRGIWLRGTVNIEDAEEGAFVGERPVRISASRNGDTGSIYTNARVGADPFRLGPLVPGRYRVWAWLSSTMSRSDPVVVDVGEESPGDDLQLLVPAGDAIAGRVVDPYGAPCEANVHLIMPTGSRSTNTGAKGPGTFHFAGLDRVQYALYAETDDGHVAVMGGLQLTAEESVLQVELVPQPGAALELTLTGERASCRMALIHDGVIFQDATIRSGKTRREIVPPGAVLVQLYSNGQHGKEVLLERSIELNTGGRDALELLVDR